MTQQQRGPGIDIEQRGRVLLARIYGGPRGEFGREIAADLAALVTRAENDDGVGAVVLTGTHPERFVAHAELSWVQEVGAAAPAVGPRAASGIVWAAGVGGRIPGLRGLLARTPLSGAMDIVGLHDTLLRMNTCGAVFIAAVNGSALGVGSELALACDYRLMAAGDSVIGQPEILVGFPPGGGGTQRLTRLIGTHQALKIMLEGAGLDPKTAAEIGYVDEVVDPDQLLNRAVERADRFGGRLKYAVAAVKRAAYIGGSRSLEEGLRLERAEFLSALANPDAQQSMIAYLDQTASTGDLPLYAPAVYEQTRESGHFG